MKRGVTDDVLSIKVGRRRRRRRNRWGPARRRGGGGGGLRADRRTSLSHSLAPLLRPAPLVLPRMEEDRWPGGQGDRGRAGGRGRGRHCRSCNAKITRWRRRRRRVDGDGNDGWGEKLSKWEVAKEPIRHLASLTHSLPRQAKERKEGKTEGEGSRRMGMGHGAEITDASPTLPHYIVTSGSLLSWRKRPAVQLLKHRLSLGCAKGCIHLAQSPSSQGRRRREMNPRIKPLPVTLFMAS